MRFSLFTLDFKVINCNKLSVKLLILISFHTVSARIVFISNSKRVREWDQLILSCQAKGNPNPTLKWIKNGKVLTGSSDYIIGSIRRTDAGTYYCLAENGVGNSDLRFINIAVNCRYICCGSNFSLVQIFFKLFFFSFFFKAVNFFEPINFCISFFFLYQLSEKRLLFWFGGVVEKLENYFI